MAEFRVRACKPFGGMERTSPFFKKKKTVISLQALWLGSNANERF